MSDKYPSQMKVDSLKISGYKKHILLCSGPECCSSEEGDRVWDKLKKSLAAKKLAAPGGSGLVYRTKVHCLRVCSEGPIAVVYPDGTWYKKVNEETLEKIIEQHLCHNTVVEESVLVQNTGLQDKDK
jgi:(2Fe-2S) ferredoxin